MKKNPFNTLFPDFREFSNINDHNLSKLLKRVRTALLFVFHSDRNIDKSDEITQKISDSYNYLEGKIESPNLLVERMKEHFFKITETREEIEKLKKELVRVSEVNENIDMKIINNLILTNSELKTPENENTLSRAATFASVMPCNMVIDDTIKYLQMKKNASEPDLNHFKHPRNLNIRSQEDFDLSDSSKEGRIKVIGSIPDRTGTNTSGWDIIDKMLEEYCPPTSSKSRKIGRFIPMRIFEKHAESLTTAISVGGYLVSYGLGTDEQKNIENTEGIYIEGAIVSWNKLD